MAEMIQVEEFPRPCVICDFKLIKLYRLIY